MIEGLDGAAAAAWRARLGAPGTARVFCAPGGVVCAVALDRAGRARLFPAPPDAGQVDALGAAIATGLRQLAERPVYAQLASASPGLADALVLAGLQRVCDIVTLAADMRPPEPLPPWPAQLRPRTLTSGVSRAELLSAVGAARRDATDWPELDDSLSAAQVLADHEADGLVDPDHWTVLQDERGESVGAALVAPETPSGRYFLFFGLAPAWRGGALSGALFAAALARLGAVRVHGQVDSRNLRALHFFSRAGFEETHREALWMPAAALSARSR